MHLRGNRSTYCVFVLGDVAKNYDHNISQNIIFNNMIVLTHHPALVDVYSLFCQI